MDDVQNSLNQDGNAEDTLENVGYEPDQIADSTNESEDNGSLARDNDPLAIKKRLGMQAKRYERKLRAMQEQIASLQSQVGNSSSGEDQYQSNPYPSPGQPNPPGDLEEERIRKAVRYALEAKDAETRKAKDAERQAHVQKQYQRLNDEFDRASDKYDDFDDVVRSDDAPFTPAMRDALLFVDNPADVAYKLGKNRDELKRISELHPLDQAREVNKLSFALMGGSNKQPNQSRPLGQIRQNPANTSSAVTDKTPPSVIRARMKAGTWK